MIFVKAICTQVVSHINISKEISFGTEKFNKTNARLYVPSFASRQRFQCIRAVEPISSMARHEA